MCIYEFSLTKAYPTREKKKYLQCKLYSIQKETQFNLFRKRHVQPQHVWLCLRCKYSFLFPQAYVNLLFWYQFFCGFSGTSMTDYWVLIFFNLLFTSAPPVIYGVLEKDVSAETLMQLPELYKSGQKSEVGVKDKMLTLMLFGSYLNIFPLAHCGTFITICTSSYDLTFTMMPAPTTTFNYLGYYL